MLLNNNKILFISDGILDKERGVGKVSNRNLDILKQVYPNSEIEVIVLGGGKADENFQQVLNPGTTKLLRFLNYCTLKFNCSNDNINYILNRIRSENYDVVFVDNSMYGLLIKNIKRKFPNVKVVSFFHDVKRVLAFDWLKNNGVKYLLQYLSIVRNESLTAKYSNSLICLNHRDFQLIEKIYKIKPVACFPITMDDIFDSKKVSLQTENEGTYLFIGADYYANVDGIYWFIKNVIDFVPGRLIIAGKGMEKYNEKFSHPKVITLGTVSKQKLEELYYNSCFVVSPLFSGGGMKVKICEALMYGKTIFGTDESFIGYNLNYDLIGGKFNTKKEFIEGINNWIEKNRYLNFNSSSRDYFETELTNTNHVKTMKNVIDFS
jgi:hypothetical protein